MHDDHLTFVAVSQCELGVRTKVSHMSRASSSTRALRAMATIRMGSQEHADLLSISSVSMSKQYTYHHAIKLYNCDRKGSSYCSEFVMLFGTF